MMKLQEQLSKERQIVKKSKFKTLLILAQEFYKLPKLYQPAC